jgi:hypothetical protein
MAEEESSMELNESPGSSPAPRRNSISLSIRSFLSYPSSEHSSETIGADSSSHSHDSNEVPHVLTVKTRIEKPLDPDESQLRENENASDRGSESESESEDFLEEVLQHVQWESLIFFITLFILAGELSKLGFMQVRVLKKRVKLSRL